MSDQPKDQPTAPDASATRAGGATELPATRAGGATHVPATPPADVDLCAAFDALAEPVVVARAIRGAGGAIEDFEVRWANLPWRRTAAALSGHQGDALDDPAGTRISALGPAPAELFELATRVVARRTSEARLERIVDGWQELRFAPFDDGFVMIAHDVTSREEAEQAAAQASAQAETLVRMLPDAVIVQEDGVITLANDAAATLVGATRPEDVVGRRALDFVRPSDRPAAVASIGDVLLTGGQTPRVEIQFRGIDGTPIDVEAVAAPLPAHEGRVPILVVAHDISERLAATAAMAEATERLERAQRAADVGFWDWDITTGKLAWSKEMFRIFGLDIERDDASFESWARVLHPDDAQAAGDRIDVAVARGTPLDSEYRIIRPSDGEERWIEALGDTQHAEDGTPIQMAGICLDVTSRKRAELALEATAGLLVEAQRAAGVGSYRADFVADRWVSSTVLDEIFGIGPDYDRSVAGWAGLIHPDDRDAMERYVVQEVMAKGQEFDREYRIIRASDGAVRWVHGLGEVTLADDGTALALTGTIQDVTERRLAAVERDRLATQLSDAQRMEAIGRLAGGIAHDFNNMLGAILGYTELALDRVTPQDGLYGDLIEIHRAAARSAELTRQLLAYARRDTAAPRVIDLNTAVASDLKVLQRLMGEEITVEWHPDPNAGSVRLDPAQLDRVLANLCVNARDAIDREGRITISTGRITVSDADCVERPGCDPGEYVTLTVADTGHGMAPNVLANAFEPFYTTKGIGEGTGLGLAMVHGIVTGAGGFIDVASSPGTGTTFTIHLPGQAAVPPMADRETMPDRAGTSAEVLLVEDEPALLALSARLLRRIGYGVTAVHAPADAVALLERGEARFDLLLTDIVMPGMSGPELAAIARERVPDIRCVFMSGYPADSIIRSGGLPPDSGFISKPFTVATLAERVRDALEGRARVDGLSLQ